MTNDNFHALGMLLGIVFGVMDLYFKKHVSRVSKYISELDRILN